MIDVSEYIGIKYKAHGRSKEEGFDCYGFILDVMKNKNQHLPDFEYKEINNDVFVNCFNKALELGKARKISSPYEGAFVLFSNKRGLKTHIGIYVGDGYIAHCNKYGVHLESVHLFDNYNKEYYIWQE